MSSATNSSTNFQSILDVALESYAEQTGVDLTNHPFAHKLKSCATSEQALKLLQDRETAFKDYRNKNRKLINCLRPVVQVIHAFSGVLGGVAGLVPFQPTQAIFAGVDVLLAAAVGVSASYDALVELFECVGNFLRRLHIYADRIPLPPTMTDLLSKIMLEVLRVLAVATKQIKQGRITKFTKKLLGDSDIEAILQRLDRLTHEEARMTMAHTLEVVYGLVNNLQVVMNDGQASSERIWRALAELQEMADSINKMKRDQLQEKIRSWLHHPDPSTNHNAALRQHHNGTAAWFTQGSTFKKWRETGPLLWIYGKPGSGKTVLCSSIIQQVKALHGTGLALIAYFYCDFSDSRKQDASGLLASLLAQFSAKSDPFCDILSDLYSKCDAGSRQPNDDELRECLEMILKTEGQPPIFIIIDAVDECSNTSELISPRDRVLNLVENLIELHLPNLRVCLTSRPEADIRASLESLASHAVSLHDQSGQMGDIADYVSFVVHSDRNMRRWRAEDKKLVVETLSGKADGMFRWIVCQLTMLRRCIPATIRRALDDLPESLDETYERILLDIGQERRDYAERLFQCLAVSMRPLRVDELAEILAIQFDAAGLPIYDATLRAVDSEDAILSTCSSLITIVNVDGPPVAQFSHFSVKEYLTSNRLAKAGEQLSRYHILPRSAHTFLAQVSLSVLLTLSDHVDRTRMMNFPLAIYAARHWVDHAQFEDVSSSIEDAIVLLFDTTKSQFETWVWIYDMDHPYREIMFAEHPTRPDALPLYYATLCRFCGVVERLIVTHPEDVSAKGGSYGTPLHAALAKKNLDIAWFLLAHDADITALNDDGLAPLHCASMRGHHDMVELLLKHHIDVNIQDGGRPTIDCRAKDSSTPLAHASAVGHLDVVRLLLQSDATVDSRCNRGWTPLIFASSAGHLEVVRLLLQSDADVDSRNNEGRTPLMSASIAGQLDVVRLLLQSDATVDSRDNDGWTALTYASAAGHLEVVRLLLQSDAAVDSRSYEGRTPLTLASIFGQLDVVRLLFQNDAAVDSRDNEGWTPLTTASWGGHFDVVRLLLQSGVSVDSCNNIGQTPLMLASARGYLDVARLLLQNDAAVDSLDSEGWSPLMFASEGGHLDVVCLFLRGVEFHRDGGWTPPGDLNAREAIPTTSLHLASAKGYLNIVQLLIKHGADLNQPDQDEETPLHLASHHGHLESASLLLESGSNPNSQGSHGCTPLHRAARNGHLQIVRVLLELGADLYARNGRNETAFDEASRSGKSEVARLLAMRMNVQDSVTTARTRNVTHPDAVQSSPGYGEGVRTVGVVASLHTASEEGNFVVVQSLLDGGVEVNKRDQSQRTPLDWASSGGRFEVARLLINRGADVNSRDKLGRTPLHKASLSGHLDTTRLLLDHGADVNATTQDLETPLHVVLYEDRPSITRLLLERGANVRLQNNDGWTPTSIASGHPRQEIRELVSAYAAMEDNIEHFGITA